MSEKPNDMTACIKEGVLYLEVPLHDEGPSASGKSNTLASTRGAKKVGETDTGKPIYLNLNVYRPR